MNPPAADRQTLRLARRRRRWPWVVVGCGLLVLAAVGGLVLALTSRPAWYQPPAIDRARLREDKAALVSLEDQISAALNAGGEIRFQLDEGQINRWLAAQAEIWPQVAVDLGPLQQPQVLLRDGCIRVAASTKRKGLQVVAALTCYVDVREDEVVIRYDTPRVGAVAVPRGWVSDLAARIPAGSGVKVDESRGSVALDNDWVWPNGKRRCRLRELQIADGVATVVLEPLRTGPRAP